MTGQVEGAWQGLRRGCFCNCRQTYISMVVRISHVWPCRSPFRFPFQDRLGLYSLSFMILLLPLLLAAQAAAYIPASPTNSTQDAIAGGLNMTDISKLRLRWYSDGFVISYSRACILPS